MLHFPGLRKAHPLVFLDIQICFSQGYPIPSESLAAVEKGPHRLVIELFSPQAPVAAKHFQDFCTGVMNQVEEEDVGGDVGMFDATAASLRPSLSYQHSTLHRFVKGFCIQGGDVCSSAGLEQVSIFGEGTYDAPEERERTKFSTDSLYTRVSEKGPLSIPKGLVGTAVSAPHLNGSQFFILTADHSDSVKHLDGTCICFGQVQQQFHGVLDLLEAAVPVEAGGEVADGVEVKVVACGLC